MSAVRSSFVVLLVLVACRADPGDSNEQTRADHDAGGYAQGGQAGADHAKPEGGAGGAGAAEPAQAGGPPQFDASGCKHPAVKPECSGGFCRIPAGCFVMGSPEDEPGRGLRNEQQTAVTLSRDFSIGQYEVTQDDFAVQGLENPSKVFESGPYIGKGNCLAPECPVGNVTWFEAAAFANLLSERSEPPLEPCYLLEGCSGELGKGFTCKAVASSKPTVYECEGYRLPTDAEWEYAARAGTRGAFYSGDIGRGAQPGTCTQDGALEGSAWYCHGTDFTSFEVGQLTPNDWGLFDVLGNLEEWISDPDDGRSSPSALDPRGTLDNSSSRYVRGGSVYAWPTLCRSARQGLGIVDNPSPVNGFRLARTL